MERETEEEGEVKNFFWESNNIIIMYFQFEKAGREGGSKLIYL